MNYPFYLAVQDFVANKSITASQFAGRLGLLEGRLYRQIIPVLLNLIDSHDTARFMHVAGNNRDKLKLAAAMQLLLPGMPMIYYGDEFGMTGGNDPDCRRGMVWDEDYQDKEMFVWYSKLTSIRKQLPALLEGELAECVTDDENAIIKMVRELQGKRVTVVFHAGDKDVCFEEYKGCVDCLTGETFDGNLRGYHALLFEQ
jgi:glycosidase